MTDALSKIRDVLNEIAQFALHSLPPVDAVSVRNKVDAADLVSNRDYTMEAQIIATIRGAFPDHTVISEEIGQVGEQGADHQWLVDPIDGSCNDSHGIPWSCVSVAYVYMGQLIAGIIIHPHTREVFLAFRGQGATCNGRPIQVSNADTLAGSVVMTELLNQRAWAGMFPFMDDLADHDATVRIMGATALSIAQVAAGRAVAVVLGAGGLLDVAAGVLIALEAGAVVLQDGRPLVGLPVGRLTVACPGVVSTLPGA